MKTTNTEQLRPLPSGKVLDWVDRICMVLYLICVGVAYAILRGLV